MHIRRFVVCAAFAASGAIPWEGESQAPPARVDFEGSLPKASAPPPPTPRATGPPVRTDFEASYPHADYTPSGAGRTASGPPARVDFEATVGRGGLAAPPAQTKSQLPAGPPIVPGAPGQIAVTKMQPSCIRSGGTVVVEGHGFGSVPRGRRLVAEGPTTVVLALGGWKDASITADVPPNAALAPGAKYTVGVQDTPGHFIGSTITTTACK
jgi:hypothetical protein